MINDTESADLANQRFKLEQSVLHVSRPATGGLKQHLDVLINELARNSVPCALAAAPQLTAAISLVHPWLKIWPLPIADRPSPLVDIRSAVALRAIVEKQRPAIVHAHGIRAAWIVSLARISVPIVVSIHNLYWPGRWIGSVLSRRALDSASVIIAVSQAAARTVEMAGIKPPIYVVPNGLVFPRPKPKQSRPEYRMANGIALDDTLVSCLARLMPDKGVDILLDAWVTVSSRHSNAHLVIGGDGPDRSALESVAANLPNVHIVGYIWDTASLLEASDIVAIPSRREGQSIVCLEAMATESQPALVVSRAGGLPEMVEDEVTGLVCSPDDAVALANGIIKLIDSPALRQHVGDEAYRRVHARYSATAMAAAIIRVYVEATGD